MMNQRTVMNQRTMKLNTQVFSVAKIAKFSAPPEDSDSPADGSGPGTSSQQVPLPEDEPFVIRRITRRRLKNLRKRWEIKAERFKPRVQCTQRSEQPSAAGQDISATSHTMQLEGTNKRKRRSSSSNGDIENSLYHTEAKRPREDDRPIPQEETDHQATEELRTPLAELNVGQPADDSESESDMEWLEACSEELSGDDGEESDRGIVGGSINGDHGSNTENEEPLEKNARSNDTNYFEQSLPSPRHEILERNLRQSKWQFTNKITLKNFFVRKLRSEAEGRPGGVDRTLRIFGQNPGLQPKMRSVLLEWIVEVCDVYKLHRETYHLTVDYLDRYLCQSENVSKGQLQLIGVTALLIAAKYEEIYPPKITDFAYITDGACTDQDIIKMENLMIQVLEWRCTVVTCNTWVLGLLQLLSVYDTKEEDYPDVTVPQYNNLTYEVIMHLLDLCTLDCGYLKFSYKVLALASLHIVVDSPDPVVLKLTGYSRDDLAECIGWMQPFWITLCQKFKYDTKSVDLLKISKSTGKACDLSHMRVKHNVDLEMLEAVQTMMEAKDKTDEISELLLTPPSSSEKRSGIRTNGMQVDPSNDSSVTQM